MDQAESFLEEDELKKIGFKSIGDNVKISKYCRLYGVENIEIGNNVRIDDFCILSGKIILGNYIHIAAGSYFYGGRQGIIMEDYSTISSHCSVYAITDDYSGGVMTNPTIPNKYRNVIEKRVHIEKHTIVGSHSVILPGVTLREGSAFGSMALINRDTRAWTLYVGIPIREIKKRRKISSEMGEISVDENTEKEFKRYRLNRRNT